jgi:lysophospholipase L1-like esterase
MRSISVVLIIFTLAAFAAAQGRPVTIFLAGDSTMARKQPDKRPETGWGEMLQQYFDARKVKIENRAVNGRSTKTFVLENHWQSIMDNLKKGDHVFIQFGHNDAAKSRVERYTPPDEYRKNLIRFVEDVRGK